MSTEASGTTADPTIVSASTTGSGAAEGAADKAHEHILKDMHRFKEEAKRLQSEVEQMKEEKLKASKDWEALYTKRDAEAKEAQAEAARIKNSFLAERKFSAVKEAALKAGIRAEALEDLALVDKSSVQVEATSTGRVNVLGVSTFVEQLKATRPHWFGTGAPSVNTTTPGVTQGKKVEMKDILQAEKKAKISGSNREYLELVKQYQAQK
jgi:seryl-tRNA synthetase